MSRTLHLPALRAFATPLAAGLAACAGGVALLAFDGLWRAALGVELVALAFWLWARGAAEPREQIARWGWLRRPAMALWLAAALHAALPAPLPPAPPAVPVRAGLATVLDMPQLSRPAMPAERDPLAPLRALEALAVLWAGLELLGALPASRPFADLTGPLPYAGPWLPAVLPAAGFLVLWRQSGAWMGGPLMRELAVVLLALAAALAVLRAYSRTTWTASLRWLAVFDSALAALLVALDVVPREAVLLLWFAAAGGRLLALAAEVRGASGRRGPERARLWRLAGWMSLTSLAGVLLAEAVYASGRWRIGEYLALAAPVYLAAALSLRRVVEAPERRAVVRTDPWRWLGAAPALVVTALGPVAIALALAGGLRVTALEAAFGLAPCVLALAPRPRSVTATEMPALLRGPIAAGATARDFALNVFRLVVTVERRLAAAVGALLRGLGAPARDLHTGDAQEYLLFLIGLSVLALVLPLLR
ncbi:MAG: hypothetical protein U0704_07620 [Candidatus Eisenbacteria bacterium]